MFAIVNRILVYLFTTENWKTDVPVHKSKQEPMYLFTTENWKSDIPVYKS